VHGSINPFNGFSLPTPVAGVVRPKGLSRSHCFALNTDPLNWGDEAAVHRGELENNVQQRNVNLQASAVVVDEAQLPEPEADTGTGCAASLPEFLGSFWELRPRVFLLCRCSQVRTESEPGSCPEWKS
jgi:hypothetical protein